MIGPFKNIPTHNYRHIQIFAPITGMFMNLLICFSLVFVLHRVENIDNFYRSVALRTTSSWSRYPRPRNVILDISEELVEWFICLGVIRERFTLLPRFSSLSTDTESPIKKFPILGDSRFETAWYYVVQERKLY